MKCTNPNCGGEWTPPSNKSLTICPFCKESAVSEKKTLQSFDNVRVVLAYIANEYGVSTLLGSAIHTIFADVTHNQLKDEKNLIKLLSEKGALSCLQDSLQKPVSEQETAIKRAINKLPKFLQSSEETVIMLYDFAAALDWQITMPEPERVPAPPQSPQPKRHMASLPYTLARDVNTEVRPTIGSIIKFSDLDWRVLEVQSRQALLISEKIIGEKAYHTPCVRITWANCALREYLNGDFYNRLGEEKSRIAESRIETKNSSPTTDKIFLLSIDEVKKYFKDDEARIASDIDGKNLCWWLRSPGQYSIFTSSVLDDGSVNLTAAIISGSTGGVRPALWLNL